MELTFNELKKRDVINIADGRCLGRITDLKLKFPEGVLIGIFVPGRKTKKICRWFDKSEVFIEERKIIKIGGDVILVDIKCENSSAPTKQCVPLPPCTPHLVRLIRVRKILINKNIVPLLSRHAQIVITPILSESF